MANEAGERGQLFVGNWCPITNRVGHDARHARLRIRDEAVGRDTVGALVLARDGEKHHLLLCRCESTLSAKAGVAVEARSTTISMKCMRAPAIQSMVFAE